MTKSAAKPDVAKDLFHSGTIEESKIEAVGQKKHGAYTVRVEDAGSDLSKDDHLVQIKLVCLHNAVVCIEIGDTEKSQVWALLAQVVDSRMAECGSAFDGWGGPGGGALGENLVGNLLQYFESLGDVQMLATMVCVLSGGQRKLQIVDKSRWYLLPRGQEEKYDTYIRRYADLLYGWGLLTIRAELNKHMIRVLPYFQRVEPGSVENIDDGRSPGIAVVFTCSQCENETDFGTNYCRSCQDYAFRCVVCENAVRGLFTVCDCCGHGGHVVHIQAWFASHDQCPSGCGCSCSFASQGFQTAADFTEPLRLEVDDTIDQMPMPQRAYLTTPST
jgi:Zinc-ribbon, C4HC2 type